MSQNKVIKLSDFCEVLLSNNSNVTFSNCDMSLLPSSNELPASDLGYAKKIVVHRETRAYVPSVDFQNLKNQGVDEICALILVSLRCILYSQYKCQISDLVLLLTDDTDDEISVSREAMEVYTQLGGFLQQAPVWIERLGSSLSEYVLDKSTALKIENPTYGWYVSLERTHHSLTLRLIGLISDTLLTGIIAQRVVQMFCKSSIGLVRSNHMLDLSHLEATPYLKYSKDLWVIFRALYHIRAYSKFSSSFEGINRSIDCARMASEVCRMVVFQKVVDLPALMSRVQSVDAPRLANTIQKLYTILVVSKQPDCDELCRIISSKKNHDGIIKKDKALAVDLEKSARIPPSAVRAINEVQEYLQDPKFTLANSPTRPAKQATLRGSNKME